MNPLTIIKHYEYVKCKKEVFKKNVTGSVAAMTWAGHAFAEETIIKKTIQPKARITSTDKIQIGLIGAGIIGLIDTDTALKVDGVELVAVCDLYDGRLVRAKEKWGNHLLVTKDYREVLARKDIDAVLICTPDHWHQRIAIDAMNAGKHVYCEKPVVKHIEEGQAIIDTQKKTGKVLQVGSQFASSIGTLEAKKYFEQGAIGELTYAEVSCDRGNAMGAWQYSIPTDASPETVDFDRFLGNAPKVPFSAERFFRWRNFNDYGTGAAGDLVVHLLTTLHTITGAIGPDKIMAFGEVNFWKDGREAYDLVNGLMRYPETEKHPSFQLCSRVNLASGNTKGGFGIKLCGTDGIIEMNVGAGVFSMARIKRNPAPGYGGYDSFNSFSAKQQEEFKKWYKDKYGDAKVGVEAEPTIQYAPSKGYDARLDHMISFFNGVRNSAPIFEDATFGLRAAGPSIACNISAAQNKALNWDAVKMKIV